MRITKRVLLLGGLAIYIMACKLLARFYLQEYYKIVCSIVYLVPIILVVLKLSRKSSRKINIVDLTLFVAVLTLSIIASDYFIDNKTGDFTPRLE